MTNIAVYIYEGISLFHISVPSAIFSDAFANEGSPFTVKFCADTPGAISTSCGISVNITCTLKALAVADILIFPSWDPQRIPNEELLNIIRGANDSGKIIVGLCLGAYLLAYAGILDNKQATTHWAYGNKLKQLFPKVIYREDPLYIIQDNIITSAGTAAAIDCCLNILKNLKGVKVANRISRVMVSAPQRSGGQKQFISRPVLSTSSDQRINQLVTKILGDLSVSYSLSDAAEKCYMSKRSFSRHFQLNFSLSFLEWLKQSRLHYSQELLESTTLTITQVSENSGFRTEQNFRKQFKLMFNISPKDWRKLFNNNF